MSTAGPPLGELLDGLLGEGFTIGVDDHVRVARLIALETTWDEASLQIALRAILAKDLDQRAKFDAVWARLFKPVPSVVSEPVLAISPPQRRRRPLVLAALACVGLIAGVLWWLRGPTDARPTAVRDAAVAVAPVLTVDAGATEDATRAPDPNTRQPGRPAASTDSAIERTTGTVAPKPNTPTEHLAETQRTSDRIRHVEAPLEPEPADQTDTSGPALSKALVGVGALLVVGGGAFGLLWQRRRARFVPGPWRYELGLPAPRRPLLPHTAIEDGAAHLTWQFQEGIGEEIDVDRSITATTAGAGAPSMVWRSPRATAMYVVLEDVGAGTASWRGLYDELLRGMAREGVRITRYTFVGDPTECTTPDGRSTRSLRDIVDACDALLVIGDGEQGFDPVTERPAPWLATLRSVARRLWINPLPPVRWSTGARRIARETPMEHGITRALGVFGVVERMAPDARPVPAIIDRAPASPLGFEVLEAYLGSSGLRVVAAMAIVGVPTLDAARWCAEALGLRLDETTWLAIVSTSWMRARRWPDGLQLRLVEWARALAPDLVEHISQEKAMLLASSEPPGGTGAHLRWEVDVAATSSLLGEPEALASTLRDVGATAMTHELDRVVTSSPLWGRMRRGPLQVIVLGGAFALAGLAVLTAPYPKVNRPAIRKAIDVEGVQLGMQRVVLDRVTTEQVSVNRIRLHAFVNAFDLRGGYALDISDSDWSMRGDQGPIAISEVLTSGPRTVVAFVYRPGLLHPSFQSFPKTASFSQLGIIPYCDAPGKLTWIQPAQLADELGHSLPCPPSSDEVARGTALIGAIDGAVRALRKAGTSDTRRVVIVVSDGALIEPNLVRKTGDRADEAGVRIDVVAHSPDDARRRLLPLAELANRSQGVFRWLETAESDAAFTSLAKELDWEVEIVAEVSPDELPSSITVSTRYPRKLSSLKAIVPWPSCGDGGGCGAGSVCASSQFARSQCEPIRLKAVLSRWLTRILALAVACATMVDLLLLVLGVTRRRRKIVITTFVATGLLMTWGWSSELDGVAPIQIALPSKVRHVGFEVALHTKPQENDEPPQIEAALLNVPELDRSRFALYDRQQTPRVLIPAIKTVPYVQGTETMSLALLFNGQETWVGNDDFVHADAPDRHLGALKGLKDGLRMIDWSSIAPPESQGMLITYSSKLEIRHAMGPISQLTTEALGTQRDYYHKSGAALADAVELALDQLRRAKTARKVMLIVSDGNDDDNSTAVQRLRRLKLEAFRDHIETAAIIYKGELSDPGNVISVLVPETTGTPTAEGIASALSAVMTRFANRQYVTFPGRALDWDGKPHQLVVTVDKEETDPVELILTEWSPQQPHIVRWVVAAIALVLGVGVWRRRRHHRR